MGAPRWPGQPDSTGAEYVLRTDQVQLGGSRVAWPMQATYTVAGDGYRRPWLPASFGAQRLEAEVGDEAKPAQAAGR